MLPLVEAALRGVIVTGGFISAAELRGILARTRAVDGEKGINGGGGT